MVKAAEFEGLVEGARKAFVDRADERIQPYLRPAIEAAEQYSRKLFDIEGGGYQSSKAAALAQDEETQLVRVLDAFTPATLDAVMAPLTKELGDAIAAGRGELQTPQYETSIQSTQRILESQRDMRRTVEANTDIILIGMVDDAATISELVDETLLSEHAPSIRRIGLAAERRLAALERAEYAEHQNERGYVSPSGAALRSVRERLTAWRAEHPSTAARVAQITKEQQRLVSSFKAAIAGIVEHLRLDSKSRIRRHGRLPEQDGRERHSDWSGTRRSS